VSWLFSGNFGESYTVRRRTRVPLRIVRRLWIFTAAAASAVLLVAGPGRGYGGQGSVAVLYQQEFEG